MSQVATIEKEVSEIVLTAKAMTVKDNDQEAFAVEFLKVIARGKKQVGEEFDEGVKNAHSLHKALTAQRKKYLDPLDEADDILRKSIKEYRLNMERERQAEEARQKAILDASVKADQDRLLKQAKEAEDAGDLLKSNKLAMDAVSISAGSCFVESKAASQEGMSNKIVWKGRVTDLDKLPREFLIITADQRAIDAYAKKFENKNTIPGVEFYQDVDMRIRA